MRIHGLIAAVLLLGILAGCSRDEGSNVVAATPSAITITTGRFTEPTAQAEAHCAQYGKKAVSRGGVKVGDPAYKIMWGYDCVSP